jgi:hypothetical protein
MKNIFLIPTPDETRVAIKLDGYLFLTNHPYPNSPKFANHHIYITNGEHPKKGDYMLYGTSSIVKCEADIDTTTEHFKMYGMGAREKIIMTTDPKLIADGVQPIPDEFLEWLVLNPTCEFVKTIFLPQNDYQNPYLISIDMETKDGKQIIPKKNEGNFCHYSGLPSPAAYVEKPNEEELRKMFSNAFNIPQEYHGLKDKPNVIVVGSGLPPAKLTLELTQKEARALLNCLSRTFAKGTDLDFTEPIEEKLLEFLKPLEK